jgi:DNA-binding transcriptional LysR family regulator
MTFDWSDIRHFLAVARGGSSLAAAKALGVNQTTVARRIEALEQALGFKLFERGQSGSRLTEAGEALRLDAEKVERAAEGFATQAQAYQRGMAGTIRLTANESVANTAMAPAIADFRRLYPAVRVEVIVADNFLDLEKGEADVAIRGLSTVKDSPLVGRKLAEVKWAFYASFDYVLRNGAPTRQEELAQHSLVGGDRELEHMGPIRWMLARAPDADVQIRSNNLTNLMHSLKAGLGVGPLPTVLGDPERDLVRCFGPIPDFPSSIWILTRPELREVPRIRAFMDFVAPHFINRFRSFEERGEVNQARLAERLAAEREAEA